MGAPTRERWAVIEPLLDQALDLPPDRRREFLRSACDNPALRDEIERLLHAAETEGDLLTGPAAAFAEPMVAWVDRRRAEAPAKARFAAGERLGPYLIEGELGRGGMATVYRAQDPRHGRTVAVKVLRPDVAGLLAGERFAREIAIVARLSHPGILPLYDSGSFTRDDGTPVVYYSMPCLSGRSLRDRLREQPELPLAEAVTVAREVAAALAYAHDAGVVHRDIKPENIYLDHGGVRVADFGIARALGEAGGERLTTSGLVLGTPTYMSPEQGLGDPLDGRADVYALGCVLYEMLAGTPPFSGATSQAIFARHTAAAVPPLATVRPDVGPDLERVVLRALAKAPANRFPSAAALEAALAAHA
ncbi:MAG TPA: serine/threonine-protein kinase [Gemmatimonadales bacterium]|nr:serine/threonine-protein kinase [Gemmatimonadales bacterium]